jgi:hypothetical protein
VWKGEKGHKNPKIYHPILQKVETQSQKPLKTTLSTFQSPLNTLLTHRIFAKIPLDHAIKITKISSALPLDPLLQKIFFLFLFLFLFFFYQKKKIIKFYVSYSIRLLHKAYHKVCPQDLYLLLCASQVLWF